MITLNPIHTDAMKEIINIASGNAATALSQILKKKIDMSVPVVEIKRFEDVATRLGAEDEVVMGTMLKVLGDISGSVMLVLKNDRAMDMANSLLSEVMSEYDEEMVLSVFQEIGNIVGNSYLNAMASFLGLNVNSSVPYISIDMLLSIMATAYIDANETDDYIIDMGCTLFEDNVECNVNILFIVPTKSLSVILEKIDGIM